jgi:hypothetical protein
LIKSITCKAGCDFMAIYFFLSSFFSL